MSKKSRLRTLVAMAILTDQLAKYVAPYDTLDQDDKSAGVNQDGKRVFWSYTRQCWVESACQKGNKR